MHLKKLSATLFLVASILLAGLLTGCGGGGDQAGDSGSQKDNGQQGEQGEAAQGNAAQGNAAQGEAPQAKKIAVGTVIAVGPDRRKIILRPSTESQGSKRMIFKVNDGAEISLDDQSAEMADAAEGQDAKIEYVVVKDQNRARVVELISSGEGSS